MINKISIIIPVRNEEKYLPNCLRHIEQAHKKILNIELEKIVVLNRSTDSSEQIAISSGCKVTHQDSKNLSMIRNAGANLATGDAIVTIDADSFMSEGMLADIVKRLDSGKVIGGGVLMYPERWSFGIALTGFMMALPLSLWHGFISAGLFYCRREDFLAIGGFNEEMYSAEDVDFAVRLKKFGKTKDKVFSTIFSSYLITSCRKFDRFGDWYYLKNPVKTWMLLKGRDQKTANLYWYDFADRKSDGKEL